MAIEYGTTAGNVLRWLRGTNLISDVDQGFKALAEDVAEKMLGYSQDTLAKRPGAGVANRLFKATDTGALYHDTGSVWEMLLGSGYASNALNAANANPSTGRGVGSGLWGGATQLVSIGSFACSGRPLRLTYRCGFIGVNLTSASGPIYGLKYYLLVDGVAVPLRDGSTYITYPLYQFAGQTPIWMFSPSFEFGYVPTPGSHSFAVLVTPDNPLASASVEGPHELSIVEA